MSKPTPAPSFTMQNIARMSVLIAESDIAQNRAISELLGELGVRDIVRVYTVGSALEWLRSRGFDVMLCAEQLGTEDGVSLVHDALSVSPATRYLVMRAEGKAGARVPDGVESLVRPVSAEKVRDFLQRARDPRGGLWCEVPELSLADILQMYHLARRSISILLSGPIAGRLHLQAGEVADAESGALRGLPALSRLLEAQTGLLRTDTTAVEVTRTISLPFEHAIFEATRQLDERRRDERHSQASPAAENVSTAAVVAPPPRPLPPLPEMPPPPQAPPEISPRPQALPEMPPPPLAPPEISPRPQALPEMPPPLQALPAEIAPFELAQPSQGGRSVVIAAGVLGVLVLLGTAGIYIANRSVASEPAQVVSSLSPQPSPPLPSADVSKPGFDGVGVPGAAERGGGVADAGGARHEAEASGDDAEALAPTFELRIVSKPSRALVKEGNKYLGRTPLEITIERASVAAAPRQFLLLSKGYRPYTLSQAESKTDVRTVAVLTPRRRSASPPAELNRASGKARQDPTPPLRH